MQEIRHKNKFFSPITSLIRSAKPHLHSTLKSQEIWTLDKDFSFPLWTMDIFSKFGLGHTQSIKLNSRVCPYRDESGYYCDSPMINPKIFLIINILFIKKA